MGEYATHNGERIKIGTCENMYYLRADQLRDIMARYGESLSAADVLRLMAADAPDEH